MYQVTLEHVREQLGRFKRKHNKPPSIVHSQTDLEQQYYQYQAYIALHTAGIHIHFREQEE
jgi:hypothetical protein